MFNNYKDFLYNKDDEQLPTILTEPWRIQELVYQESIYQRFRLFCTITSIRLLLSTIIFLLSITSHNLITVSISFTYSIIILIILLMANKLKSNTENISLIYALIDILILGYIVSLSDTRIEISFIFFSIILSAMLLRLFQLILIIILSSSVIIMGCSKDFFISMENNSFSFRYNDFESFFASNKHNSDHIFILIIGLFIIAILTNHLTNLSFKNEIKAQFRYRQIRQILSFNRSVIEHLKSGILVLSNEAKVISINQRAIELLNLNESQAIINLSELSKILFYRFKQWQITGGEDSSFTYKHNDGADEVFITFASFGKSEQKKIIMVTLESVNEAIQQTQEAKLTALGRLTAGVAHEIRNPLSSINSAAQLLIENNTTDEQKKLSQIILKNVKRTNQIIDNILGLFKDTKAERSLIPVLEKIKEFRSEFKLSNNNESYDINIINNINIPIFIIFDPEQLIQVLWNLAQNSLKYANVNNLIITISLDLSKNRKMLYLSTSDNGKGIDSDIHSKIFEPFYAGEPSGSGLGLYLVRELCSVNNANIKYIQPDIRTKDHNKKGVCFRISIPIFFSSNIKPNIH